MQKIASGYLQSGRYPKAEKIRLAEAARAKEQDRKTEERFAALREWSNQNLNSDQFSPDAG